MIEPTPEQKREMLDLRQKVQSWIDELQIAGMDENAIVTAIHLSLIERALRAGGVAKTAAWLRAMAKQVEVNGPAMLKELKAQGH